MGRGDQRPVPPLDPAPHPNPLPCKTLEVETRRLEGVQILSRNGDGEVAPPVFREVHIDPFAPFADRVNRTLDDLIGMREPAQALRIGRILHAIGP